MKEPIALDRRRHETTPRVEGDLLDRIGGTTDELALPDDPSVSSVEGVEEPSMLGEVVDRNHVAVETGAEGPVGGAAHPQM